MAVKTATDDPLMTYREIAAYLGREYDTVRTSDRRIWLAEPDDHSVSYAPRWRRSTVDHRFANRRGRGAPGHPGRRAKATEHVITVVGPLAYPGGKNGMYQAHCSCGNYTSAPNGTARAARANGDQHATDKVGEMS